MDNVVKKAKEFAENAHKNHTEDDTLKTPYIFHLQKTATLVRLSGGSEDEIAAAWLHDTVEDTEVTLLDIIREFGDAIAEIVDGLTDLPEWKDLPFKERKKLQAERVSKESDSVRRVKIADQISGGELDARNVLFNKELRKEKLECVAGVARACNGVSMELDALFESVYQELVWFLNHTNEI